MLLLEATNWDLVWMVTILGFGIVLLLLVVLIYIMKFLGFVMQKIAAPKKEKKPAAPAPKPATKSATPTDEGTMAAIAMALAAAQSDDEAAIAMALHLYYNNAHDIQTTYLTMSGKPTAWNSKSFGMNNQGF